MSRIINQKDKFGKDIHVGDAFEYGDCIYIVSEQEDGELYIRQFENQVQYGVEANAEYIERPSLRIEDVQFNEAEIIGDINNNETIKELNNREYNPVEAEEDEYGELDW